MQTERSDLIRTLPACAKASTALNREGRERLLAAFELVNGHFEQLFWKLFGGGKT